MSKDFSHDSDPFSYQEDSDPFYEAVQEEVGGIVETRIDALKTELGVLAQFFFAEAADERNSDLNVLEILKNRIGPVEQELASWLDW